MMLVMLVALYVLQANGWQIPTGCFVTAWSFAVIKGVWQLLTIPAVIAGAKDN